MLADLATAHMDWQRAAEKLTVARAAYLRAYNEAFLASDAKTESARKAAAELVSLDQMIALERLETESRVFRDVVIYLRGPETVVARST